MNNQNPQPMTSQSYTQIWKSQLQTLRKQFSGLSTPDAEDIVQEAWYSMLIRRPNLLSDEKQLGAYLRSICFNMAYKQHKQSVEIPYTSLDDEKSSYYSSVDGSALDDLLSEIEADEHQHQQRLNRLRKALHSLPEQHFRLLQLFYCKHYSMEQIAEEFDLKSKDVAKTIKYRIIQNLRRKIQQQESAAFGEHSPAVFIHNPLLNNHGSAA